MSSLGNVISKSAPILGNILNLALPGSGLIVAALAKLFGTQSDNQDTLASAISADPEAYLKLKEFELTHRYDLDQILANDRDSARKRDIEIVATTGKRDWVMEFIAIVMVSGFFGMCFIISFFPLAKTDTNLLYLVIGQFSTGFITVLSYFFGATKQNSAQMVNRSVDIPPPSQTR